MLKLNKIGYSLKDVTVIQTQQSYVEHRSEVDPYVEICGRKSLPVFVAPMATVTDETNYKTWIENKVTPVIPRTVTARLTLQERMELSKDTFVSLSLEEAFKLSNEEFVFPDKEKRYICVDIANGTMQSLYDACYRIKTKYGETVEIMTGNIANPEAYRFYCKYGIDWVRCSVGTGSRCISACNTAIYYPMATLLDEINAIRLEREKEGLFCTKVIADGGIGWFDDIQKSIALGADAVMTGRLFNECFEACYPAYYAVDEEAFVNGETIPFQPGYDFVGEFHTNDGNHEMANKYKVYREYFGMSTRTAQALVGSEGKKTSEGISKPTEVKYPVAKFVDNMTAYLRSCMSYAGTFTIDEFRCNSEVIILGGSGDVTYRK